MFRDAISFDQPLADWNISNVIDMTSMFNGVTLSTTYYTEILIKWATLPLQSNVIFGAGGSRYNDSAIISKNYIVTTFGWTITDGGEILVPSKPETVQASSGNQYVYISWAVPLSDGGGEITDYSIYRSLTNGTGYISLINVSSTTFEYNDTTVTNGETYYYVIRAVNEKGESQNSDEVIGTPATVPSAPTNIIATSGNLNVTLSWDSPSDNGGSALTGYNIYRSSTSGTGYISLINVSSTTFEYNDTTVTNGETYYYVIRAVNEIGESQNSDEVIGTPASVPSAPTNIAATPGILNVTLSWDSPSDNGGSALTGYNIYRSSTNGSGYSLLTSLSSLTLTYTDVTVSNGETYYYVVRAVNEIGESQNSDEVSAVPINDVTSTTTSISTSTTTKTSSSSSSVSTTESQDPPASPSFEFIQILLILSSLVVVGKRRPKK
jgi:predicted phage tail protein